MFSTIIAIVGFVITSITIVFALFMFLSPWGRNQIFEMELKNRLIGDKSGYSLWSPRFIGVVAIWVLCGIHLFG